MANILIAPVLGAQTVRVNWQSKAPFASYKTFAWHDPQNPGLPFYGQWIKPEVITALTAKGLQQAASGQAADVVVTFHIRGQEVMDADTTSDGWDVGIGPWGGGWGWYGGWGGWDAFPEETTSYTSEHPRQIAILTVDIFDAKSKKLVWRGQATVENVASSEKGDEKQTEKCVQKMFKKFPPQ
jgi:hypothetical protein